MTQNIQWDKSGEKTYETGVDHGVLYPMGANGTYPKGVAWNGLTTVTESPSGAEATALYADNMKYLNLLSAEQFGATIEAYTYPDEFSLCDGTAAPAVGLKLGQQARSQFGVCYRTLLGNDVDGNAHGYKLHVIYGAQAAPSERAYGTVNDSPEAITFSWAITTTPVSVAGYKATASLVIDSKTADPTKLAALEAILYGVDATDGRLPLPDEIVSILTVAAPSVVALSTIVPADDASGVAVGADIVITFNNKIVHEAVTVASAAGVIVAGAKTWDVTGKILTFNPTINLSPATTYIVTVAGVVDVYSQALATEVKNFATT
jgi:hypothetical protein